MTLSHLKIDAMKKSIQLVIISFLFQSFIFAQPCFPDGIIFDSQEEIDLFKAFYPDCTEIGGDVVIVEPSITDLSGLNHITSIDGYLLIWHLNEITDIPDFDSLRTVNGYVEFRFNNKIQDISGFKNLESIGQYLVFDELNKLEDISGFNNLESIGGSLSIIDNNLLSDVSGFQNLASTNRLIIYDDYALEEITGLQNLKNKIDVIYITRNILLKNLSFLNQITNIGESLTIGGNTSLLNLNDLQNINYVNGNVIISQNNSLHDLSGCNNLNTINGNLTLDGNILLDNLSGLENLDSINGHLIIQNHVSLNNLDHLSNLRSLKGELKIENNAYISDLTGLANLNPESISGLTITSNASLSECAVQSICDYLSIPVDWALITINASGCYNRVQVENECGIVTGTSETDLHAEPLFSPNPATNQIQLSKEIEPGISEVKIYNQLGGIILNIVSPRKGIDISSIGSGIYIIEFVQEKTSKFDRLIIY